MEHFEPFTAADFPAELGFTPENIEHLNFVLGERLTKIAQKNAIELHDLQTELEQLTAAQTTEAL